MNINDENSKPLADGSARGLLFLVISRIFRSSSRRAPLLFECDAVQAVDFVNGGDVENQRLVAIYVMDFREVVRRELEVADGANLARFVQFLHRAPAPW